MSNEQRAASSGCSSLITHHSSLRLGCLPYLNVKPLIYPFEHGALPDEWKLIYEPPSALAGMLSDGTVDVAPVSSFACLADPKLTIVPGICIASDGPVRSVLMLSKVEPGSIRTVATDSSSLSGRALLRIILAENYGVEPELVTEDPGVQSMLSRHDAALIIGNPAMLCDKTGLNVLDLGEEWMKLTGLPAVFAVWAGIEKSLTPELIRNLSAAKEEGTKRIREIAEEESPRLGLPFEICEDYLANVMRYDLGSREMESLHMFGRKSLEHGLIDSEPTLRVVQNRG